MPANWDCLFSALIYQDHRVTFYEWEERGWEDVVKGERVSE